MSFPSRDYNFYFYFKIIAVQHERGPRKRTFFKTNFLKKSYLKHIFVSSEFSKLQPKLEIYQLEEERKKKQACAQEITINKYNKNDIKLSISMNTFNYENIHILSRKFCFPNNKFTEKSFNNYNLTVNI